MQLVSVIVPVYNMESFLSETLDSILASDYPRMEVVVYDDGSTDNSYLVAQEYAQKDSRVKVFTHQNSGVCKTRNNAVRESEGEYILPVDADDLIVPNFISEAVKAIELDEKVKVVTSRADYFGARTGEWKFPEYSFKLLARKNFINISALYRKKDWARVGGYCEDIAAREDWVFWVSMLKDGGKVVKLPFIALHYRVRTGSKRISDRAFKNRVIDILNVKHIDVYAKLFGGPLRYKRTQSGMINKLDNLFNRRKVVVGEEFACLQKDVDYLHWRFKAGWGKILYSKRNELREVEMGGEEYVVKSFAVPNIINRIAYGFLRASKAERAYLNAEKFLALGISTPKPVAFVTRRVFGMLLKESYFVSEKSDYPITFNDIIFDKDLEHRDIYLRFVGEQTALMHEAGLYPLDYSGGNILLDMRDGMPVWHLVDLNRMRFGSVDLDKGCWGFSRLNLDEESLDVVAKSYAMKRGFDADLCSELIKKYRWKKHKK